MKLSCKVLTAALLLSHGTVASHIRKDLVEVENDTIVLVTATTVLNSNSGRISHLPVSPAGPADGTKGLVYLLPEMIDCQPVERSDDFLAASYIRIALISDDGECPIEAKVKQAQFDGAVGAFVYNSSMGAINTSALLSGKLSKDKPTIPVMVVDRDYGETLKLEVTSLQEESQFNDNGRYRAIFASMYSETDVERLSGWEISLITLVVVLALCFCTSMSFHVSPSRRQRSDRALRGTNTGDLSKQIQTLPSCALDRLPLRTVNEADVKVLAECTTPLDSILNPNSHAKSISNRSTKSARSGNDEENSLCGSCGTNVQSNRCDCNGDEKLPSADAASETTIESPKSKCKSDCNSPNGEAETSDTDILQGCIATCIVCIDDFVVGSKMRILPCGHNYHIECIDPWLTAKSSLCPLCKYDTRSVLTDLERTYSGPRILVDPSAFDDILDDAIFRDSDDNSSYLAESRPHLPIRDISRRLYQATYRGIATPIRALVKKFSRRNSANMPPTDNVDMVSVCPGRHTHHSAGPFENAHGQPAASVPAGYVINVHGDDGCASSASTEGDDNHMVQVKTKNPSPYFAMATKAADFSDKEVEARPDNSPRDGAVSQPRLSISENLPSIGDMTKYFK
ncbi:hypothetical protein GGI15_004486 [Coemansia interrupta]|uniref:RING-type E3 ubiquitin transferase n=1 Tax=Coemansia interrupta TaxID=1126814 RepID=A0A9W8H2Y1_9FUNG|nr:hypothetical protein GGI15_004486 [Coemansia interrupta]